MKILYASPKLGAFGGVEQHVAETALGLQKKGHSVHLAFGHRTGRDETSFQKGFESVHSITELGGEGADAIDLEALLSQIQPDLLYLHKAEQLVEQLPANRSCAVISMVHDHDLCCPRSHKYFPGGTKICNRAAGWRCWLDGAFLKKDSAAKFGIRWNSLRDHKKQLDSHRSLDALIVASRSMRDELLLNDIPPQKIFRVAPGVGDGLAAQLQPIRRQEKPIILFVGQMIRGKGVDLLIQALAEINQPFQAMLVGDGNARGTLEALAKEKGVHEKIEFLGWVPHDQLGAFYGQARLVVVPSRWPEPFGLIGPEAMRHGRPTVAFDVGGIPDWLEDGKTGLLVPEQDIPAMGKALQTLVTDAELAAQLGAGAAERYQKEFMLEHGLSRLETALGKVLIQGRKAA